MLCMLHRRVGLSRPFMSIKYIHSFITGTLIIVAALTLHTIPAGLCFRPLSGPQNCVRKEKQPGEEVRECLFETM